jgi:hypothetical protein
MGAVFAVALVKATGTTGRCSRHPNRRRKKMPTSQYRIVDSFAAKYGNKLAAVASWTIAWVAAIVVLGSLFLTISYR